jgi:DNA-binding beta-propeller fold protein YncE
VKFPETFSPKSGEKKRQLMKTHYFLKYRPRVVAAGILLVAAAALAATATMRIKLPWAAPISKVGVVPFAVAVDVGTNTTYVVNVGDNTISVVAGSQCNAGNASHCAPIATMRNVGFGPSWPLLDSSSATLYVTNSLTESGDDGNTVAVLDIGNCNAHDISGCSQPPVAIVTVGSQAGSAATMTLDSSTHTLYVGDATDGAISMVNSDTCNARQISGCNQVVTSGASGAFPQIDQSNHSVYVVALTPSLQVFNGATCNVNTQSDCSMVSVAQLPADILPWSFPAIDSNTHTLYLPAQPDPALGDQLGYAAIIDGSTCNGTNHSGCAQTPPLVQIGAFSNSAFIDETTNTVYMVSVGSNTLSVIDAATCNGQNPGGCPRRVPALATGLAPVQCAVNPSTHTVYSASTDTNTVWVLDASQCNSRHSQGCTKFARITPVGGTPMGLRKNPDTHSLYVANYGANTVSIIDTNQCNQNNPAGCNRKWPKFNANYMPRFFEVNRSTNSIYVSLLGTNELAVINGATCNASTTSGCFSLPRTPVGHLPQQLAVDETTNTIYVVNQGDDVTPSTVSIVDGSHCNGSDTSGCHGPWPVAPVGVGPQALTFNPNDHTVYVTNTDDNTVSVIDTTHCNAADSSGCTPVATFPVGAGPRAASVVFATDTLFVADRDDLSVSVIDASTCNGTNISGCPQVVPPAVQVGAFPDTAGVNATNIVGRSIKVDQQTQRVFIPVPGDSDVVFLDGNVCRADNFGGCVPKVVPRRMGGFPVVAELDEASSTVYVTNNADATVSVFPGSF